MNHRERFRAIFNREPVDRIPVYFFGTWHETKKRWKKEGLDITLNSGSRGPQVPWIDPDWDCDWLIRPDPTA